ncbi:hypothetical protein LCGC14_1602020 [marine sediment metagenome]|uniref:Uncharacterized protein n=1 Tax=marine sediment metagenome TaxID=412755 RepID=A0A0F9LAZ2_9ZZZZ|nr:hypothetical protein [Candidatus Scalindua sp.]
MAFLPNDRQVAPQNEINLNVYVISVGWAVPTIKIIMLKEVVGGTHPTRSINVIITPTACSLALRKLAVGAEPSPEKCHAE